MRHHRRTSIGPGAWVLVLVVAAGGCSSSTGTFGWFSPPPSPPPAPTYGFRTTCWRSWEDGPMAARCENCAPCMPGPAQGPIQAPLQAPMQPVIEATPASPMPVEASSPAPVEAYNGPVLPILASPWPRPTEALDESQAALSGMSFR